MADEDQRIRDIQREYLDFLDDEVSDVIFETMASGCSKMDLSFIF